jgi:hypothetical protein
MGGWGPSDRSTVVFIPNRNVIIANNIVFNPPGYKSQVCGR